MIKVPKPFDGTRCLCGDPLPVELLFALSRHKCACGRKFIVIDPKGFNARFVEEEPS